MTIVVMSAPNLETLELGVGDEPLSGEVLMEPALWIGNGSLRVPQSQRPTNGIHEAPRRARELVFEKVAS